MRSWLESLEAETARRLDDDIADYFARGSGSGITARETAESWTHYRWRPRVLRDASDLDVSVSLWGDWSLPVGVAPTAYHKLSHPEGEIATARGASLVGAPFVLSSRSTCRIEEVADAVGGPWWFQVYLMQDRAITKALVQRASACGATALVLTGDTPWVGYRQRAQQARPLPLRDELALTNVRDHLAPEFVATPWRRIEQDPELSMDDIDWLASVSELPIIVKGVLHPSDAAECVNHGASSVWVSNHGGRQFDRSLPTAQALAPIVEEVGDEVPVIVDSGIRDGIDVLTALALGASLTFVGRPALWGLVCGADGAGGAEGVRDVLTEFGADVAHWLGLAGAPSVDALDTSYLAL